MLRRMSLQQQRPKRPTTRPKMTLRAKKMMIVRIMPMMRKTTPERPFLSVLWAVLERKTLNTPRNMVRTFKKPILTKNIPLEVNTERNIPMPSRFMKGMPDIPKEQTEREKYLARLNAQIYQKEREWEEKQALVAANTVALDESFRKHAENLTNQIQELESQLVL